MKCKYCNGTGTSNTCVNGTFKPCTFCDGTGEYEPFDADVELDKLYPTEQTNKEYMQTCNAEELGCFICENFFDGACGECKFCEITELRHHCTLGEWLKEKHDDKSKRCT